MLAFAKHQSHLPILDKHLGLPEVHQTPILDFRADVSLNSSNCVLFFGGTILQRSVCV